MKKILALVLICTMMFAASALAESKGTLKMGTNATFPPYEYYDDATGEIVGIDAEVAAAICEKLGYELEIVDMDFSAIIPAITSVDDLFAEGANHKVGVQLGTTGDIYCTGDIQDAGLGEVVQFNNGTDAVLALTTGKVDCVVIDNEPAKKYVEANEGLKILDTSYTEEEYAIAFAKDSALTAEVNAALEELIADGTVQAIVDKYIAAE